MVRLLLISMVLFIVACTQTYGKPITADQIASLERGVTTKSDLLKSLGKPVSTTTNSDGTVVLSWVYMVTGIATYTANTLSAEFSEDGLLRSYTVGDASR